MSHDDEPHFVPTHVSNAEILRDDGDGMRIQLPRHTTVDDGRPYHVQPACGIAVGEICLDDRRLPIVRMNASESANALVYVMTAMELRAVGSQMLKMADAIDEAAAAAVPEAFRRKPGA